MDIQELNLARKWRSVTFDDMVGQDLTVRIIKNSLYRGDIFPVYLLSGLRGCGKTTTGRLFAAALNCEKLELFQKEPQAVALPCRACRSCKAMQEQAHPDFIEIDAASHTGVENVRAIIEAASFLPVLGKKKVYLIDEAHMLSKAAFNAFLKILEEPPRTVVFFLATTEAHKIIDTVRSRCFQLFFQPIPSEALVQHLAHVCQVEGIAYETEALRVITEQAEGSARDALNIVERVRIAYNAVTYEGTLRSLGLPEDAWFDNLIESLVGADEERAFMVLRSVSVLPTISVLWKRVVAGLLDRVDKALKERSSVRHLLLDLLETCYHAEALLLKSQTPALAQELFIIKLVMVAQRRQKGAGSGTIMTEQKQPPVLTREPAVKPPVVSGVWQQVIEGVQALQDPLLESVFRQAVYKNSADDGVVTVIFPAQSSFFKDLLDSSVDQWMPIIKKVFGPTARLNMVFEAVGNPLQHEKKSEPVARVAPPRQQAFEVRSAAPTAAVPATDRTKALLKVFSGTVTHIKDGEL